MLRNFLLHGIRVYKRQKSYFFLNITGLSIGIATSLFIVLFIISELSYDRFHENRDRIYRVLLDGKMGDQEVLTTATASPVGPYMQNEFPGVEAFCRFNPWGETILSYGDRSFPEDRFAETDSAFFTIFSFELLQGNPKTVLNEPYTLVLSSSVAHKIFGEEEAVGRMLKVGSDTSLYRVTGIMKDFPNNSHIEVNILGSFMTNRRSDDNQWLSNSFTTYVLLNEGTDPETVNDKFPGMIVDNVGSYLEQFLGVSLDEFLSGGNRYRMELQNLLDIHLQPEVNQQSKPATDPRYLYIFGSIAFLIIIIAVINFMNLSTAQASRRAMEVGVKKVSGSTRGDLIKQFLVESAMLTFLSVLLAFFIVWLTAPSINQIIQHHLDLSVFFRWYSIPVLVGFSIFVGLLAGSYPAFFLSSFKPVKVLKSGISGSKSNSMLRSFLVVLQFTISIMLIVGTLIMHRQLNFMLSKDLGFEKERILVIPRVGALGDNAESFKNELKEYTSISNVSFSTAVPGRNNNTNGYSMEGRSEESFLLETNWVDYDFFDTYGISLKEGVSFRKDFESDKEAVLINQAAVKSFSLDSPLESRFINRANGEQRFLPVIGVVENFHFRSLHSEIMPYIFRYRSEDFRWGYASVKLNAGFDQSVIDAIKQKWKSFTSEDLMTYFFLDTDFNQKYHEEKQNASLSILFSILAVLIASLGLFGLTSYTIEARTKEIGIRKVMGASVFRIFFMISKEISLLVLISTFIAWPGMYFIGKNWLENYYYRTGPGAFSFLAGLLIALMIAIITISIKAYKTAVANPTMSLRYE